jgi:hypothetical protein
MCAREDREFAGTDSLVRFTKARGPEELEPTVLVKCSTLLLKYVVRGARIELSAALVEDNALAYALTIYDDMDHPAMLWSIVEREDEKTALIDAFSGKPCSIHLFNEASLNTSSTISTFSCIPSMHSSPLADARVAPRGTSIEWGKDKKIKPADWTMAAQSKATMVNPTWIRPLHDVEDRPAEIHDLRLLAVAADEGFEGRLPAARPAMASSVA